MIALINGLGIMLSHFAHNYHLKVREVQHYFLYRFGNLMIPNLYWGKF